MSAEVEHFIHSGGEIRIFNGENGIEVEASLPAEDKGIGFKWGCAAHPEKLKRSIEYCLKIVSRVTCKQAGIPPVTQQLRV